ncbi:hypothetical protein F5X99DRAFT_45886 [Biscogniauxia marginata]|nr:hypothetical protein F5X99DRAFT_45886 [Biscogniauxia marginata]
MSGPSTSTMSLEELTAYMNRPAFPPPPGVIPNFEDPPNNNAAAIATMVCSLTLCCSFSLLYAYMKLFVAKKVHIADYIALVALGVYLGLMVRIHDVMTHGGYFVHQWNLRMGQMPEYFHLYKQGVIFYVFSAMLVRQAILLQWITIFVPTGTRNAFFWTCHIVFWINTVFYLATGIVNIVGAATGEGFALSSASMNVVIDVIILFLPQRVIWNLNMSFERKLGVSIVFSLGVLACTSAIARVIVTAIRYAEPTVPGVPQEQTMHLSLVALLSTAETTFGLLVLTVTGIPKALNNLGMTKLPSLVKSWFSSLTSRKDSYYNVEECDHVPLGRLESDQHSDGSAFPSLNKSKPTFYHDDSLTTNGTIQQTNSGYDYNHVKHGYIV